MATRASVEQALAAAVAGALYPDGIGAASAVGVPVRVFRGWPDSQSLDADLARGVAQISIYARPGMARVEGRRLDGWLPLPRAAASMTATAGYDTVTFAGTGMVGQMAGIIEGGRSWTAPAEGTPAQVAAALAALMAVDRPAVAVGGVITLQAPVVGLEARVVPPAPERIVLRQQWQGWQISSWCPTVESRDAIASLLDLWVGRTQFMVVGNDLVRVAYTGESQDDDARKAKLLRHDMMVSLCYPTTDGRDEPVTVIGQTDVLAPRPDGTDVVTLEILT